MHPVHPHPQKGLRQHRTMKAAALCEQIALVPLCGIAVTSKKKGPAPRGAGLFLFAGEQRPERLDGRLQKRVGVFVVLGVDLRVILARAHAEERTAAAVQIMAEILAPAHRVMQERAAAHTHDAAGAERVVFRGGKNVLFFKGKLQMVLVGQLLRAGEHTATELREIVVVLAAKRQPQLGRLRRRAEGLFAHLRADDGAEVNGIDVTFEKDTAGQ